MINLHGVSLELPELFVCENGQRVASVQQWRETRRPEILELFRQHVYGRAPIERPDNLHFEVEETSEAFDGAALRKRVAIHFAGTGGEGVIHLTLFVPAKAVKPAPCFLLLTNRDSVVESPTSDFWPADLIVERGYAAAVIRVSEIDPDFHDDFQNGVHAIFDVAPRAPDAWGTIAAWSWGGSRVLDYLETDDDIDAARVAVVGHSRGGKAALWAGAQDERFALVVSNNSGCTGAALSRGKKGETIGDINEKFPHWFCENYKSFNGQENQLPIDQHQFLALIAPRPLYVASASEDDWADPVAEYASAVAATPVYKLFGLEGLAGELPAIEQPQHKSYIGYHLRRGDHDLTRYDWQQFLAFADWCL